MGRGVVNDQIDRNGQRCDRNRRRHWRERTIHQPLQVLSHHAAPVRYWRLHPQAQKAQARDEKDDKYQPETKIRRQRHGDVGKDFGN